MCAPARSRRAPPPHYANTAGGARPPRTKALKSQHEELARAFYSMLRSTLTSQSSQVLRSGGVAVPGRYTEVSRGACSTPRPPVVWRSPAAYCCGKKALSAKRPAMRRARGALSAARRARHTGTPPRCGRPCSHRACRLCGCGARPRYSPSAKASGRAAAAPWRFENAAARC